MRLAQWILHTIQAGQATYSESAIEQHPESTDHPLKRRSDPCTQCYNISQKDFLWSLGTQLWLAPTAKASIDHCFLKQQQQQQQQK